MRAILNPQTSLSRICSCLISIFLYSYAYAANSPNYPATKAVLHTDESMTPEQSEQRESNHPIADFQHARKAVQRYKKIIAELKKTGGAYNDHLSENMISLGLAYEKLSRYEQAVHTYNEALHINRVNQGLENPMQFEILDLIIAANTKISDWEALDQNYKYLYWLARRKYVEDPMSLLFVIARITRWYMQVYLTKYDPTPFDHMILTHKLCHDAVEIIEKNYGLNDLRLIGAEDCIVATNRHINSYLARLKTWEELEQARLKLDHIIGGLEQRKALYRIADIYAEDTELPAALRVTELVQIGDWFFFTGKKNKGVKYYNIADKIQAGINLNNGSPRDLFVNPEFLNSAFLTSRGTRSLSSETAPEPETDKSFVKISFDVTRYGRTSNIRIIETSDPEDRHLKNRARDFVRWSFFRPRILDGKPVTTEGVEMKLYATVNNTPGMGGYKLTPELIIP